MIYKHRFPKVPKKQPSDELPDDEFFLTRGLTGNQLDLMDGYFGLDDASKEVLRGIVPLFAQKRGLPSKSIKLRKPQIDPVMLSYINPRFFIGDKPGLGKTVMSAASYAYYGMMQLADNKPIAKVLVVTESAHVVKFAKEWQTYGINVMPLSGGTLKTERSLEEFNFNEHDGLVIGWDGLKTNGFLEFYLRHHKEVQFGVFDETSKLLNPKSMLYQISDSLLNTYQGGFERVLFLNGSSFEKNIYDFFYQFNILQPKLIPSKSFLDRRYVVKTTEQVYRRSDTGQAVRQQFGKIVDYKNQAELKDRLRYYFIARSKEDFTSDVPQHEYNLHVVDMTSEQRAVIDERLNISLINSPATNNPENTLTMDNSPKLNALINYVDSVRPDRPIIYVYNKESQQTVAKLLEDKGYKLRILNGDVSAQEKSEIIDQFNGLELDTLVFNIQKAINLPSSDRIIFYDIPTMPQQTSQIKARIDRNNYTTVKYYDFFCYYESPEWVNISRLGHFREHHSNEFTGQQDNVYSALIKQMDEYLDSGVMEQVGELYEKMYRDKGDFKDIERKVATLLNAVHT